MAARVLLCTSDTDEAVRLSGRLSRRFDVSANAKLPAGDAANIDADLIILDANCTAQRGIDAVMQLLAEKPRPILYLAPPDEPMCAIEAMRLGVTTFLVKTEAAYDVIELAAQEAVRTFGARAELEDTVTKLQLRVQELEAEMTRLTEATPTTGGGAADGEARGERKRQLLSLIIERLNRGDVHLPAYPDLSRRLDAAIESNQDVEQISRLLRSDPAVAARLISLSNSAAYHRGTDNRTIEQALTVLGLDAARSHVALVTNRGLYTARHATLQPMLQQLWQHASATAHLARVVAARTGFEPLSEAFSMGLLHDIGKLFLLQVVAELDGGGAFGGSIPLASLPQFLDDHHAAFGRKLLSVWKIPVPFSQVVEFHHCPDQAEDVGPGPRIVHLADMLADVAGVGDGIERRVEPLLPAAFEALGLDAAQCDEIVQQARAELSAALPA